MPKSIYHRSKPHVNVLTIGHEGHGKTNLQAAMCRYSVSQRKEDPANSHRGSELKNFESFQDDLEVCVTKHGSIVTYETDHRLYTHFDCPGKANFMRNMRVGASEMDAAILVVSAMDGPMVQTLESILLAKFAGISHFVVFLNKCDVLDYDEELIDLVETEVRDLLNDYDFPGDQTPIIRGSATKALEGVQKWEMKIKELLDNLDAYIPEPERQVNKPFLMPISETYFIEGRGTVVTGTILRGTLSVGDEVSIEGIKDTKRAICTGLEFFGQILDEGRPGDNVGVLLSCLDLANEIERGQLLAAPNSVRTKKKFVADIYAHTWDEGGRHTPFSSGYMPQFYFHTVSLTGTITLSDGWDEVLPGHHATVTVELIHPFPVDLGLKFSIRESGITVGSGVISKVIE